MYPGGIFSDEDKPTIGESITCTIAAILLVVLLPFAACHHKPLEPVRPLPDPAGVCEPGIEACELRVDKDVCGAALACVDARESAEACEVQRRACEALRTVDVGEQAQLRANAEVRVSELETQRWYWALGGTAVGAVIVGLLVGLAGR